MAKKKTKTLKGTGAVYNGSNSNSVIDVIKIYGKKNTVKARKGNDQITLYKGDSHKVYGGDGRDTITVGADAGKRLYVYGDAGNDIIKVKGGVSSYVRGGDGDDTITVTGGTSLRIYGNDGDDKISVANVKKKNYIYGGAGADTITVSSAGNSTIVNGGSGIDTISVASGKYLTINGASGKDRITIKGGTSLTVNGGSSADKIYVKGGSGHKINGGTAADKIYIYKGTHTITNDGGSDYIEIKKGAGNKNKIESGVNAGYKLNANETVKVLGGKNHDIRLYGGNDKVIIAGGSGHTVYTDGPTGSGDAGGNDIIVIQDGGRAKKIVAGEGDDVIAVANGAGNGSVIYSGLEDPAAQNAGSGNNTVNLLGGSGHTVYLGGTKNSVLIESQNVVLNTCKGTTDDITVRWSEQGTGTLRINCANDYGGAEKSTLRLEGVNSYDFNFSLGTVLIKNGISYEGYAGSSLIMEFTGSYERETRDVNTIEGVPGTIYYQNPAPNEPNDTDLTCLPVYVNTEGRVQYNWCNGNEQFVFDNSPVVTAEEMTETMGVTPTLEIARWGMHKAFSGITFDNGTFSYNQITNAAKKHTVLG